MLCDCHIHMVLDGENWRAAIDRHRARPEEAFVRRTLARYAGLGFSYLRDGGDRWGVNLLAKRIAPEYGIRYAAPGAPLCKAGHYGGFIGEKYADRREFTALVEKQRRAGADFVKVMISGIMDFDRFGVLSEPGMDPGEIRQVIAAAKDMGLSVMAHANGTAAVLAAVEAGVDSIEHGAYLDREALEAMAERKVIWVPTLSAVGNLRGRGRFPEEAVEKILKSAMDNGALFADLGGLLAPGTDAGAWAVPHGSLTEYALLEQCLGARRDAVLERGIRELEARF